MLTALAFATSAAWAVIFRISFSVTSGLLAKPQTPPWMTRTPKPALSSRPRPPNPNESVTMRSRTATLSFTLRVNRMSAYEQPMRFASDRAMSDRPLKRDSSTCPRGDWATRSPIRSLA